jgi:hypothetical protein
MEAMKQVGLVIAGAVAWIVLSWALTPRTPDQSGALARLDSARVEAEHRADSAVAELDAMRDTMPRVLAQAAEREREAAQRAARETRTAQTSGATVRALLDSLGASTEAWDAHVAADSALAVANEDEKAVLRDRAALWERRATLAELALDAKDDALLAANATLVEAMDRLGLAESRAARAERSARLWQIVGGIGAGAAVVQTVVPG